ncbi:hypothetical protein QYF68_26690 [Mycolicibacterium austroafricanum]|uniref:Uncharacterized protein n=1 Tax=Mycolicibacterium austroafricanum TaxID=39687 RepID=A0ABT8HKU2_MYCAO|nr:hypothetical protein [Mycolicibacterium austroafricanum]MDN4521382.1 hypothetical protein [Mycolicibacterium austroafricanum]
MNADPIAQADQHYAQVRDNLDTLVALYRVGSERAGMDPMVDLVTASGLLADPKLDDGTTMPPGVHAKFLADLLAVAIDRMARS